MVKGQKVEDWCISSSNELSLDLTEGIALLRQLLCMAKLVSYIIILMSLTYNYLRQISDMLHYDLVSQDVFIKKIQNLNCIT